MKYYLAIDLGASSGRVIAGSLNEGCLALREIYRFWNGPTEVQGTLYWDFLHLYRNIQKGIDLARKEYGNFLVSVGVDAWGVDFGLLDENGQLLGNPVHYRDRRTKGMLDTIFMRMPKEKVFSQTGIQAMEINTLCQLAALSLDHSPEYRNASKLLFSPDLIGYWLTGNMVAERSIASTSQCYDPVSKDWAYEVLESLGIRTDLFAELVNPGTVIGNVDGLPVVAVGGHDTASAFAAVPVGKEESCAFLSSGTWSLLGTELPEPILSDAVLTANFTNEVGVCDTIRFLKNLSGLWILQELRRNWNEAGCNYSWTDMENLAMEADPFEFLVDPSDELFLLPGNMHSRIQRYCERTGQTQPETHAQLLRAVYEGLALLYADTLMDLERLSGRTFETLRIVGGGSRNLLLNQMASNATGRKVIAGPTEATAIGNLLLQILAMGDIQSLQEGRQMVQDSFASETIDFVPQEKGRWQARLLEWQGNFRTVDSKRDCG